VTDRTRGPEPWFVLTGDTLFSGGVGRPDLLGAGAETPLAEQLYDSLFGELLTLPDHIEVYPAHFSGAARGKGLSGKPGSTIGFERTTSTTGCPGASTRCSSRPTVWESRASGSSRRFGPGRRPSDATAGLETGHYAGLKHQTRSRPSMA
jgi:glyoxylase-like metal-dependent hydrolase (beta-lactamase superfamily II)